MYLTNLVSQIVKFKRGTKRKFFYKERSTLSKLSKPSPRKVWKYLNKFKRKSKNTQNVGMQDFVNHFNNNTTTDDVGSVNDESNDGLDSGLTTGHLDTPIAINKIT